MAKRTGMFLALCSAALYCVWAFAIPPLAAPDEPAHLQTVMELRKTWRLPEVHYAFDSDPRGVLVGSPGDASVREYAATFGIHPPEQVPYESMQPPLYYLAVAAASYLVPLEPAPVMYLARIIAALFGAAAVYMAWATVRILAPESPVLAVAVAAFIAILPGFSFNSATAANDSIANFLAAAAFYIWARGLRYPETDSLLLKAGAITGLAIVAKLTAVALLPGLAVLVIVHALNRERDARARLRGVILLAAGALAGVLITSGWWLVRNMLVYGDITGSWNTLQYYRGHFVPFPLFDRDAYPLLFSDLWKSFWGKFGWMTIELPPALYVSAVVVAMGAFIFLVLRFREQLVGRLPLYRKQFALVATVSFVSLIILFMQANVSISWASQARYFFVGLLPVAMLITSGYYMASRKASLRVLIFSTVLLWLTSLNVVGLVLVMTRPGYLP